MEILLLDFGLDYIYAEVQGINDVYIIRIDSDGYSCSCQDNSLKYMRNFQYKCKHIDLIFLKIRSNEEYTTAFLAMINGVEHLTFLLTGLKCVDSLFGGIPRKILFGLVGMPESGKTTLLTQLLFHILFMEKSIANEKEDGISIAFIDGEGGIFDFVATHWIKIFNDKYNTDFGVDHWHVNYTNWENQKKKGTKANPVRKGPVMEHIVDSGKRHRFHVIDLVEGDGILPVFKLNLLVGKPSEITTSSKGKETLKSHERQTEFQNIKNTLLAKFIEDHNTKAIGLDSLTMVVESTFGAGTESFPARAKNNMQVCHQLQRLTSVYNLYTIVNHHLTKNPQQGQWATPMMTGGKGTRHNFKYQLYMDYWGRSLKPHPSKRWIGILRSQTKARGSIELAAEITANGVVDVQVEQKEKLK